MARDWLLVETLGSEPAVVALGRQLKNLVPITTFLRRNPNLAAIQTAIAESLQSSQSTVSITPKSRRVIRTEPVLMSDGRMHGVHIWSGPAEAEPPERPIPGPLKWDMTLGVATDTPESLANTGRNPEVEDPQRRAFADSWPSGDLKPNEGKALAAAVKSAEAAGLELNRPVAKTNDGCRSQASVREPGETDDREHRNHRGHQQGVDAADLRRALAGRWNTSF